MANEEHVAQLRQGVDVWNAWRRENPDVNPNLSEEFLSPENLAGANLAGANLNAANLAGANLAGATLQWAQLSRTNLNVAMLAKTDLSKATLDGAYLKEAILYRANLFKADLTGANLTGAYLKEAILYKANLFKADLTEANLTGARLFKADLRGADLRGADLTESNLTGARLTGADLTRARLTGARLTGADLSRAILVETDLTNADLTSCRIYGIAAWGPKLEGTMQQNLVITNYNEPEVTADNIEVAQFIYLLLHNPKIREIIDTVGEKAVLILGRFTEDRKKVLDDIREELRKHDYVPILFDFDKPASQNLTATIMTLARLSRFIIADLTDPSSIPYELGRIVPVTKVAVQPILLSSRREFAMFPDLQSDYPWVLPIHHYDSQEQLITDLLERVIRPAEAKVLQLREGKPA